MFITDLFNSLSFITPAYAQAAAPGGFEALMSSGLGPILLILPIMYFLLIRPQQRRAKAHQEMVKNLRRGDVIVMNSGMIGKVSKIVDDLEIEVEIAEGVRVRMLRGLVGEVRSKTEPVAAAATKPAK